MLCLSNRKNHAPSWSQSLPECSAWGGQCPKDPLFPGLSITSPLKQQQQQQQQQQEEEEEEEEEEEAQLQQQQQQQQQQEEEEEDEEEEEEEEEAQLQRQPLPQDKKHNCNHDRSHSNYIFLENMSLETPN